MTRRLLATWCCEQAYLQDLGVTTHKNCLLVTAELSNANVLVRYLQDWGDSSLFSDNGTLTGNRYKRVLRYYLIRKLSSCHFDIIFQREGDPPLYKTSVRQYLDHTLRIVWTERRGPTPWSLHSLNFTPSVFLLCRYIKDQVFCKLRQNNPDLEPRIWQGIAVTGKETLQNAL